MPPYGPDTVREIIDLCGLVLKDVEESDSPIPSTEPQLIAVLARSIDKCFCDTKDGNKLHSIEW